MPIAFSSTQVRPRLVEPASRLGEAMGATRLAAALELVELMHLAGGQPVHYSIEVFAPGSIDLHVIRGLKLGDEPAERAVREHKAFNLRANAYSKSLFYELAGESA